MANEIKFDTYQTNPTTLTTPATVAADLNPITKFHIDSTGKTIIGGTSTDH